MFSSTLHHRFKVIESLSQCFESAIKYAHCSASQKAFHRGAELHAEAQFARKSLRVAKNEKDDLALQSRRRPIKMRAPILYLANPWMD